MSEWMALNSQFLNFKILKFKLRTKKKVESKINQQKTMQITV